MNNITLIYGGTDCGKTTFAAALAATLPEPASIRC